MAYSLPMSLSWPARLLVAPGLLCHLASCGRADEAEVGDEPTPQARSEGWANRLLEPDAGSLLEALAQPHAIARARIGPHRIVYEATYSLIPFQAPPALPTEGAATVPTQHVSDRLELLWLGEPEGNPTFSLSQHNDGGGGRDVVATDGRLFTRLESRRFVEQPVETDAYELWLNDAQVAAHDAIAFVAPSLGTSTEPLGETDRLRIDLGLQRGDATAASPPESWRSHVQFDSIRGHIELDGDSGLWRSIDVEAAYVLKTATIDYQGSFRVIGAVDANVAQNASLEAPSDVIALPERRRLQVERDRILDGLAAR